MQSKIDFYLINESDKMARGLFACRLIEKLINLKHPIVIYSANKEEAEWFDELLWNFKPVSFIAHQLIDDAPKVSNIILSYQTESVKSIKDDQVIINLSDSLTPYTDSQARIVEIITQEPETLQASRERYKLYQSQGRDVQLRDLRK